MADGSQTLVILKTNCFLILAIALGLQIDSRDLYPPNDKCVVPFVFFMDFTHEMVATRCRR